MTVGRLVVTGATGFLGRHLLDGLPRDWGVWAISRGSPTLRGVSLPANARWMQADVADEHDVRHVFAEIERAGGAEVLLHLASHFDFTGEDNAEYRRTNVDGTKNVLEAARRIGIGDVIFASSVAACEFPPDGTQLTENSPADGDTPYAASKRDGEALIAEYRHAFRCWIVRFAALFSDWCEYEPLFRFIETWMSRTPRRHVLAGRGLSAIPFLHIRDAVSFVTALLAKRDELDPSEVLLASSDGSTSHLELFEAATVSQFGERARPILFPRSLCRPMLHVRDVIGQVTGYEVFERPWMARMIDRRLDVDASRTRRRLGWSPRPRLSIARRMPFVIQNRKAYRAEWYRRNQGALRSVRHHDNRVVHQALDRVTTRIATTVNTYLLDAKRAERFPTLQGLGPERALADLELLLAALSEAVRVGEKAVFQRACRSLARRRLSEGLESDEIVAALHALNDSAVLALAAEGTGARWSLALYDHVTMTVQFGVDEVHDVFDDAV